MQSRRGSSEMQRHESTKSTILRKDSRHRAVGGKKQRRKTVGVRKIIGDLAKFRLIFNVAHAHRRDAVEDWESEHSEDEMTAFMRLRLALQAVRHGAAEVNTKQQFIGALMALQAERQLQAQMHPAESLAAKGISWASAGKLVLNCVRVGEMGDALAATKTRTTLQEDLEALIKKSLGEERQAEHKELLVSVKEFAATMDALNKRLADLKDKEELALAMLADIQAKCSETAAMSAATLVPYEAELRRRSVEAGRSSPAASPAERVASLEIHGPSLWPVSAPKSQAEGAGGSRRSSYASCDAPPLFEEAPPLLEGKEAPMAAGGSLLEEASDFDEDGSPSSPWASEMLVERRTSEIALDVREAAAKFASIRWRLKRALRERADAGGSDDEEIDPLEKEAALLQVLQDLFQAPPDSIVNGLQDLVDEVTAEVAERADAAEASSAKSGARRARLPKLKTVARIAAMQMQATRSSEGLETIEFAPETPRVPSKHLVAEEPLCINATQGTPRWRKVADVANKDSAYRDAHGGKSRAMEGAGLEAIIMQRRGHQRAHRGGAKLPSVAGALSLSSPNTPRRAGELGAPGLPFPNTPQRAAELAGRIPGFRSQFPGHPAGPAWYPRLLPAGGNAPFYDVLPFGGGAGGTELAGGPTQAAGAWGSDPRLQEPAAGNAAGGARGTEFGGPAGAASTSRRDGAAPYGDGDMQAMMLPPGAVRDELPTPRGPAAAAAPGLALCGPFAQAGPPGDMSAWPAYEIGSAGLLPGLWPQGFLAAGAAAVAVAAAAAAAERAPSWASLGAHSGGGSFARFPTTAGAGPDGSYITTQGNESESVSTLWEDACAGSQVAGGETHRYWSKLAADRFPSKQPYASEETRPGAEARAWHQCANVAFGGGAAPLPLPSAGATVVRKLKHVPPLRQPASYRSKALRPISLHV